MIVLDIEVFAIKTIMAKSLILVLIGVNWDDIDIKIA